LIPTDCRKILGSAHTLLRQEFPELREAALTRRQSVNQISSVLVSTGGGDDGGVTLEIVRHLSMLPAMTQPNVTVIMPDKAASYLSVRALIDEMGDKAKLLSNVKNMEQHIYDADFAFGSGGTTAWERCCLGLPTALVVLAENQKFLAQQLEEAGAAILIDMKIVGQSWVKLLLEGLNHDMREYSQMVRAAAKICDGMGARRVVKTMRAFNV
jgi:spore coat polysaccharide biosynthesis predicted glycosyltransferase SpsG